MNSSSLSIEGDQIEAPNPNENEFGFDLNNGRSRVSKVEARADDLGLLPSSFRAVPLIHQGTSLLRSDCCDSGGQMLSFCSSDSEDWGGLGLGLGGGGGEREGGNPRNQGMNCGGMNGTMQGTSSGKKGGFTIAQWVELEHQALIYKHLIANLPVPSTLLFPLRKALSHSGFPGFFSGSYPPHSFGWGPFHQGFSGNTDPEHGRCRRTDGKKWRCSRDVVPDKKYCERHINRSRHRSRKPVEGHNGQAALSSSVSSSNAGARNENLVAVQHRVPGRNASTESIVNRVQDSRTPRQINPFEESSFGLISRDSSDCTELTMSIPMSSDFLSSSSSPNREKNDPFEGDLTRMNMGFGGVLNELARNEGTWVPVLWGNPMGGGPLGEALTPPS